MPLFTIDESLCTQCGACAEVCPVGTIIEWSKGRFPAPGKYARSLCIGCGHCVSVCPTGAFRLASMPLESLEPVDLDLLPPHESVVHLMKSRRSIRRFLPEEVESGVLDDLIKTASYAPTGHNSQSVSWLVVTGSDKLRRFSETTIDWMRYLDRENHPAAAAFGVKRLIAAWDAGTDLILRDAPHMIVAHGSKANSIDLINCTTALTWLELAAAAEYLGVCWAGFVTACAAYWPPMQELLGLPEGRVLQGAMMIGYPKYAYKRIPLRKEPDIMRM